MAKYKAKLTQAEYDALDEGRREDYIKGTDGYILDADGIEDVSGLKSALRKYQDENTKIKERSLALAEQYKDLDPEKAREALKKLAEQDEKLMLSEGKIEEMFATRTAALKRNHQAQLEAAQKEVQAREDKLGLYRKKLSHTALSSLLAKAGIEEHVDPDWMDYLHLRTQAEWRFDEEATDVRLYNGDQIVYGHNGNPMNMNEWIRVVAKEKPKILLPSSGGGANGGGERRTAGKDVILTKEQVVNPKTYREAKAQAEKQGGEVLTQ